MEKFANVVKECALWLASFSIGAVFCYGLAAIVALVCGWL